MHEKQSFEPEPKKLSFFKRQCLTIIVALLGPSSINPEDLRAMRAHAGVLHKFETPLKRGVFPKSLAQYMESLRQRRFKMGREEHAVHDEIDAEEEKRKTKQFLDGFRSDDS